ncbi:MAG: ATP-dependent DNA helicase RecG, partial [Dehalococcoidia bacterium]|nr:ATP-dependent DNA helicase RecG [Dehalococcoidia bacterium]
MNGALQSLRKVLELERQKGCADAAVMGGLDSFLAANHEDLLDQEARAPAAFPRPRPSYRQLGPIERSAWLEQALAWIGTAPPPGSAPAASARPAAKPRLGVSRTLPSGAAAKVVASLPTARSGPDGRQLGPDDPIAVLPGVQRAISAKLARLGIKALRDLLYTVPRRYLDYSQRVPVGQLQPGRETTIEGLIWESRKVMFPRPGRAEAAIGDDTGNLRVVWFNQPYMADQLEAARRAGKRVILSGKVGLFQGRLVLENPDYEFEGEDGIHTGRLVPIYPLTEGLAPRTMRRLMKAALDRAAPAMPETLPPALRQRAGLLELPRAIQQAHFPDDQQSLEAARRRLAFDELLAVQLGVLAKRRQWQGIADAHPVPANAALLERFLGALPFQLTAPQERALHEVLADLARPVPMSRLLQGDVGSGKTVVAAAALVLAAAAGLQGVLMAPTEILAEQHFQTFSKLLEPYPRPLAEEDLFGVYVEPHPRPITIALLTGSTPAARRRRIYEEVAAGRLDILIGTHAVIQRGVEFQQLALAVVDEQHRFGVMQREALRQKTGGSAHVLVMTATPIPRTLALTLYGDLDLSLIDQLPPGRQPVRTRWVPPEKRPTAYQFVRGQVKEGRQA